MRQSGAEGIRNASISGQSKPQVSQSRRRRAARSASSNRSVAPLARMVASRFMTVSRPPGIIARTIRRLTMGDAGCVENQWFATSKLTQLSSSNPATRASMRRSGLSTCSTRLRSSVLIDQSSSPSRAGVPSSATGARQPIPPRPGSATNSPSGSRIVRHMWPRGAASGLSTRITRAVRGDASNPSARRAARKSVACSKQ